MKLKIEYRQYKRQDKKELVKILARQVYNDFFEKERDAQKYARYMLKRAIAACKYKRVAVAGDKVMGAIFGIKKDKSSFLFHIKKIALYCAGRLCGLKKAKSMRLWVQADVGRVRC